MSLPTQAMGVTVPTGEGQNQAWEENTRFEAGVGFDRWGIGKAMESGAPGEDALCGPWRRFWGGRLPRRVYVTEITPGFEAKRPRDALNLRDVLE
jgi:hypothetical protein